jgi:hypothetical protein
MTRVRLRSVSGNDEKIRLDWHDRKPVSTEIEDESEVSVNKEVKDEVIVPANGFVTLKVRW